jgi:hypothetical protein
MIRREIDRQLEQDYYTAEDDLNQKQKYGKQRD